MLLGESVNEGNLLDYGTLLDLVYARMEHDEDEPMLTPYAPAEIAYGCRPSGMQPTEWALPTPLKQGLLDWFTAPDFDIPKETEMSALVYTFIARRQGILEDVRERDETPRDRQKTRYDAGVTGQTFHPGQAVMLEDSTAEASEAEAKGEGEGNADLNVS